MLHSRAERFVRSVQPALELEARAGRLREAMSGKENPAELLVICVVMIILSILGAIGSFSRGLIGNLDSLLFLFVSLLVLLIFTLLLFFQLKQQGWFSKHHKDGDAGDSATAPAK